MIDRVNCFLDDFRLIKAYFDKPFDTSNLKKLVLRKNGVKVNYHLEELPELTHHYKYLLILEEDYNLNDVYTLSIYNKTYKVKWRHIISKPKFEALLNYDIDTLGSFYTKDATLFRLYAPSATSVHVHLLENNEYVEMLKVTNCVWQAKIDGDLEEKPYRYLVKHEKEEIESTDPFSYSNGPNDSCSYVLDTKKFYQHKYRPTYKMESICDAIIYEMSVRDMTSAPISGTQTHSLFNSLCEEGTSYEGYPTGLDYIKSLGITHVQLMPVLDFGSVDEVLKDKKQYNWGYDPSAYNVVEGTFVSDLSKPYLRVNEFALLVDTFHKHNIRVNLDVVFNHVYHSEEFSIEKITPYSAYRYFNDEDLSNGSYCGNEIRSEGRFMSQYIKKMCERYIKLFNIDGLRFDLMGLVDIDTVNECFYMCKALKNDFVMYGEGWDMPSPLETKKRSSMNNNYFMENVGFFNPHFRDAVKGPTMMSNILEKGYVLGNLGYNEKMKDCLSAYVLNGYFKNPTQSVNYIECHDNMTFYDKMKLCVSNNKEHLSRAKLGIAFTLLSQGVPFIHSGQEYMRTKQGLDNTYNSGDYFNQVDYILRNQNMELVDYTKELIKIRKKYPELRLKTVYEIKDKVRFTNYYEVLIYEVGRLKIFINPSIYEMLYELDKDYRAVFINNKCDDVVISKVLAMKPLSITILEVK